MLGHHTRPQSCNFSGIVQVLATVTSARAVLCKFLQQSHPPGQFCASSCNRLFFYGRQKIGRDRTILSSFPIVTSAAKAVAATHSLRHNRHCPW